MELMLGLNITLTEKLSKRQKILAQNIMYNGKLNENNLSIRVCLYENLKPRSSVQLPQNSLVEELRLAYLQCYVWLSVMNGKSEGIIMEHQFALL